MNPIEQNALYILKLLVEEDRRMGGRKLSEISNLSPRDINDAIKFLEDNDAVDVLKGMRTSPYDFVNVDANTNGRYLYHEKFSESRGSIIDKNNPSSFEESVEENAEIQNDKKQLKAFISYSNEDKHVGVKIKEILDGFGINSFMAHSDIEVSEEWKVRILEELKTADVFIPILSDKFKKSDWCSQEAGIACCRDILFIPLSLDRTKPYGFMNHRQGTRIKEDEIPVNLIIKPIADKFENLDVITLLINSLRICSSYRNCEKTMANIEPYFDRLNRKEINDIIKISIDNDQIYPADRCRYEYLPKIIEIHEEKIDKTKLEELSKLMEG